MLRLTQRTLFHPVLLNNFSSLATIDVRLRNDVRLLGQILGVCIKNQDQSVFDSVEKIRNLSKEWRNSDLNPEVFKQMVQEVERYDAKALRDISRSFANFLALVNSAEFHHSIRKLKESLISLDCPYGLWPNVPSCASSILTLKNDLKLTNDEIMKALVSQQVEIVLTAHPTEVNRRTMLMKHGRIKEILSELDRFDLSNYEKRRLKSDLNAEVRAIWDSDDLRRLKPTPIEEARAGLAVIENIFWHAVPNFLHKLDDIVRGELHHYLSLESTPIKIASWMGGDRDGNPNVTPAITLEVSMMSRWVAATLFKQDIHTLRGYLSLRTCSEELKIASNYAREPYREILKRLENRLQATIDWTQSQMAEGKPISLKAEPLKKTNELLEPLMMIHRSVVSTGMHDIADGILSTIIRRVNVFGLALIPMDIRQESTRHTEALDAITKHLGIGAYGQWDEPTRCNWLQVELASKRPLFQRTPNLENLGFSDTVIDTLKTFELAANLTEGSLGAYVISHCEQASDVLAVMLLQKDAGITPKLKVVPLFETLNDLQRSADIIDQLFSMAVYRGLIGNQQQIMVGYSDSAKDAGLLAACWAQYNAQEKMIKIANKYGVSLTFFHGKGGTVNRGGNPALYQAILGHPPNTINGRFRITEQGEMITQNYGQEAIAVRTLDIFTAGVLTERFTARPEIKKEWIEMMETLSTKSCEEYRKLVMGNEKFIRYFREATPESELSGLNVGSRPAKRNPKGGIDSLRAIPWVFAWTQTRLNLPTWLGVGEALEQGIRTKPEVIRDMYKNWPWFSTFVDLIEMIVVKSEKKIAEHYEQVLVKDQELIALGQEIRNQMDRTRIAILSVTGANHLQENNLSLLNSLNLRNRYLDPLNIIQVELLKRLRFNPNLTEDEKSVLKDALLVTINGIANGMRNSG